jgi:hypothetical protein
LSAQGEIWREMERGREKDWREKDDGDDDGDDDDNNELNLLLPEA